MEQDLPIEETNDEQIKLENELLRIKLQAELGAKFCKMGDDSLPPEVEQMFLQQIQAFHKHIAEDKPVPLRQHLGNPTFPASASVNRRELGKAWRALSTLLEEKQIRVDFLSQYDLATKYAFIVEELFDYEIETPIFENQYVCFIYEEFHPDHEYDLRRLSKEFIAAFFRNNVPAIPGYFLSEHLYAGEIDPLPLDQLPVLLDRFHGMFQSIQSFEMDLVRVQVDEEGCRSGNSTMLGFSEGMVRYWVRRTDQHEQMVEGPFRLFFQQVYGCWEIFFFELYGFSWPQSTLEMDRQDDRSRSDGFDRVG